MKMSPKSGAALAATAAALLFSGALVNAPVGAADAKGHCIGANACGGKGACKTAKNECGGKNKCKGQGFLEMTKAECDAAASANKDEKVQISFEAAK
ncbi:MAG: hypothetical protein ABL907_16705 [Hyphomicrobium sp.]